MHPPANLSQSRARSYPNNFPRLVPELSQTQVNVDFTTTAESFRRLPILITKSKMSAPVENVPTTDAAVTDVAATLADTSISGKADTKANDDNHASAVEGRRLYIGNLAYATSEGKLTEFFKGYLV